MDKRCIICGYSEDEVVKLFCFPCNPDRMRAWNESLGIVLNHYFSKGMRICNRHFSSDSFIINKIPLTLKREAVPIRTMPKDNVLTDISGSMNSSENIITIKTETNSSLDDIETNEAAPTPPTLPVTESPIDFKSNNSTDPNCPQEDLGTDDVEIVRFDPAKRPSGAQRRKFAIEAAKARGEPIRPRKLRQDFSSHSSFSEDEQRNNQDWPRDQSVVKTPYISISHKRGNVSPLTNGDVKKPVIKFKVVSAGTEVKPGTSTGETNSYTGMALKMAVVLKNYPEEELTDEQAKSVQHAILGKVWQCPPGCGPRFVNSYFEKGVLYITCADEPSKKWLLAVVQSIQPWEGAILRIGTPREIIRITKMAVWIPKTDLFDLNDHGVLFQLFETQNCGLEVYNWKVISKREDELGTTLILYINEGSLKALEKVEYKAYLGFHQVTFRILGRKP